MSKIAHNDSELCSNEKSSSGHLYGYADVFEYTCLSDNPFHRCLVFRHDLAIL